MENITESIKDKFKVWGRTEWIYWAYSKVKFNIQPYIDDTFEACQIIDDLWLGSLASSCNREALKSRNIETIISAVLGASAIYPFDFNYEKAKLRDVDDEDILNDIEKLLPIMRSDLMLGRGVLCHCHHGKSRSVTIVAAYLIKYHNMSADEALSFIKNKRTQIDPNPGYIKQLYQYEKIVQEERIFIISDDDKKIK